MRSGLHPRRADARDGASVLRLLGLSGHRLLRADRALRHAAGLHVPRRPPAPARHRRDPRLGAVAFSRRRARPRLLRRHASVRARRPAQGFSPGVEQLDLQLRPRRGAQLPRQQRAVLARQVPRRRAARGCRRLDAVSRLRAQAGRMDPESATAATRTSKRSPSCAAATKPCTATIPDTQTIAEESTAWPMVSRPTVPRRPRLRPEMEHGLDARHAEVLPAGPDLSASITTTSSPSASGTPSRRTSCCRSRTTRSCTARAR